MTQNRIRIADVADALGLSTATVSNVIHGKTEKISDTTVKRVQQELESSGYIPNMAGILLARNNSSYCSLVPRSSNGFCRCFAFQIGKICCHHCIIQHFQFRKCLPVNNNQFYTTRFAAPMIPASFPSAEVTMSAIYP